MPTVYSMATEEVHGVLAAVMEQYHGGLHDAEVTVDCLFAYAATDKNGDPTGPALKKNNYPCVALIKVTNHKDRVKGAADVELCIDGLHWEELSYEERAALIDHELEHLEYDGDRDDGDRPKLKIRPHDREIGWFDAVVRRHGRAALECQALGVLNEATRQMDLPFMEPEAAA